MKKTGKNSVFNVYITKVKGRAKICFEGDRNWKSNHTKSISSKEYINNITIVNGIIFVIFMLGIFCAPHGDCLWVCKNLRIFYLGILMYNLPVANLLMDTGSRSSPPLKNVMREMGSGSSPPNPGERLSEIQMLKLKNQINILELNIPNQMKIHS